MPQRRQNSIVRVFTSFILGWLMTPSPCSISTQRTPRQPRSSAKASPTGPPPTMMTWVRATAASLICRVQQCCDLVGGHRPIDHLREIDLLVDRGGDVSDVLTLHADGLQRMRHVELRDERGHGIRAVMRRLACMRRIERDPKSLGDAVEPLRRDLRHETHAMRQRDARRDAMRHVPGRPDLVTEGMRDAEPHIDRAI